LKRRSGYRTPGQQPRAVPPSSNDAASSPYPACGPLSRLVAGAQCSLVKQRQIWQVVLDEGRRTAGRATRRYCGTFFGVISDCTDDVHRFCPQGCEMTISDLFNPNFKLAVPFPQPPGG
jgi:hypothetical protein